MSKRDVTTLMAQERFALLMTASQDDISLMQLGPKWVISVRFKQPDGVQLNIPVGEIYSQTSK